MFQSKTLPQSAGPIASSSAGRSGHASRASAPASSYDFFRVFDVVLSLALLLFLSPLMVVLAGCIWAHDGGAPIFAHRRIGKGGALFPCLKFRTMVVDAEPRLAALLASDPLAAQEWARDHKLRRDPRVTWLGAFLRASSLDELPQLLNVLFGQMSLVGPRPIVTSEIYRYGRRFSEYCAIKPGLTGLWQVSGRNDIAYNSRVALDVLYVRKRSVILNLRILLMTIPAVLFRRGSY